MFLCLIFPMLCTSVFNSSTYLPRARTPLAVSSPSLCKMLQIERQLVLEEIAPSPRHVITASCLRALANLGGSLRYDEEPQRGRVQAVRSILSSYFQKVNAANVWVNVMQGEDIKG